MCFLYQGENATLGQFPFMALLGFFDPVEQKIEYICGGSLINRLYVLTCCPLHNLTSWRTTVSAWTNMPCQTSLLNVTSKTLILISFRMIVLDELVVSTEKDCTKEKKHCTTKQSFTAAKIHVHEGWKKNRLYVGIIHLIWQLFNS